MKKFIHYGKEVIYQQLNDATFRDALDKEGISYIELPLIENDVLMYEKNGIEKYACIVKGNAPDVYIENVYITTQIPLDLSWENLLLDCLGQTHGEEPMRLKTKAKMICEKSISMVLEENVGREKEFWTEKKVDPREFRLALCTLGYSIERILEMDHYDVSSEFLEEMSK